MSNCVTEIRELETLFSSREYDGAGTTAFVIEEGTIPIILYLILNEERVKVK